MRTFRKSDFGGWGHFIWDIYLNAQQFHNILPHTHSPEERAQCQENISSNKESYLAELDKMVKGETDYYLPPELREKIKKLRKVADFDWRDRQRLDELRTEISDVVESGKILIHS